MKHQVPEALNPEVAMLGHTQTTQGSPTCKCRVASSARFTCRTRLPANRLNTDKSEGGRADRPLERGRVRLGFRV